MNQQKKLSRKEMRVDFEGKIGTFDRFKQRVLSFRFLGQVVWMILRYVLLIGISYIILFPFITKVTGSFMSASDFADQTVKLIPKTPTLEQYIFIIKENGYWGALWNTARVSVLCGLFQTLICAVVGYGFAKFKFKGRNILFIAVVISLLIPHDTLLLSMFMKFRYFDIGGFDLFGVEVPGIIELLTGNSINLLNTEFPLYILSITGLAFKNGLYIFIFRQFYKGVPDELEEAAYIDGKGVFGTFFQIIMPLSVPMMTTVFMFSFSWQWTDTFYTSSKFFTSVNAPTMLTSIVGKIPPTLKDTAGAVESLWESAITNTSGLLVILPLFIIFLFAQRSFVEGIERSGIVG